MRPIVLALVIALGAVACSDDQEPSVVVQPPTTFEGQPESLTTVPDSGSTTPSRRPRSASLTRPESPQPTFVREPCSSNRRHRSTPTCSPRRRAWCIRAPSTGECTPTTTQATFPASSASGRDRPWMGLDSRHGAARLGRHRGRWQHALLRRHRRQPAHPTNGATDRLARTRWQRRHPRRPRVLVVHLR